MPTFLGQPPTFGAQTVMPIGRQLIQSSAGAADNSFTLARPLSESNLLIGTACSRTYAVYGGSWTAPSHFNGLALAKQRGPK